MRRARQRNCQRRHRFHRCRHLTYMFHRIFLVRQVGFRRSRSPLRECPYTHIRRCFRVRCRFRMRRARQRNRQRRHRCRLGHRQEHTPHRIPLVRPQKRRTRHFRWPLD